ncbi:MAG: hypothetical protein MI723_11180, partial [Caulobacterales bacterium]|nr:hypothetical protein [Caulobacterales bacterium]
ASGRRRHATVFELKARAVSARARERAPLRWITMALWGVPFGHGLRPERAVFTLAAYYLIGVVAAWGLDARGLLIAAGTDAPCGAPNPWLYAVEMLAPIIDLGAGEADNCQIRRDTAEGVAWRAGRAAYQILGLILMYLTVLTFTGALKREGDE